MHTPPNPGRIAAILAVALKVDLLASGGDCGRFPGYSLTVESDGANGVQWLIVPGDHPPEGLAPRYLHCAAHQAIVKGKLDQDGTLVFEGQRWTLVDRYESGRLVATLAQAAVPV